MNGSSFDRWTRKLATRRSRRSLLQGATGASVALAVAGGRQSVVARPEKVALCHGTGTQQNPYTIITVSSKAADAHVEHGDFAAIWCDDRWSCEFLPLFCNSANECPTHAEVFCPGGPLDPTSSDQAKAACEACFGAGACVQIVDDCSGAGWLETFNMDDEPPYSPMFGYEISQCSGAEQPAGRVFTVGNSVPETDYGAWGTATCP